ncbi:MAG: type II secretion system F family protein [Candidatus Hydrogenedentes bacterium]|nr:type II secretion system F family protein [Candidatus Hydrogenedentota bacterium]
MAVFEYEVKKSSGELLKGKIEAESRKAAVSRLRELGYFPIKVEEISPILEGISDGAGKRKTFFWNRVRLKDRNIFLRQLANLFESGMVLSRALRTIMEQTPNPAMIKIVERVYEDVQKGSPLADALEKHPKVFPAMYCSMVRAGETGGMLDEVLWRIVSFSEQEEELRGKIISALVYPIFLLAVGSIAIFILVSFVFPKFVAVFEDFNAKLPLPTVVVMAFCTFMGNWWWLVLLIFVILGFSIYRFLQTTDGKKLMDTILLRIPVVGDLAQKYEIAKFARTFGTLMDNGVPVLTALRITGETLTNTVLREEVLKIHDSVKEGDSISDSMKRCVHFPPIVVSMFAVGEEGGRIGVIAKRVADAYDVEVDRAVKTLVTLFEPILIIIMGVIIGFLVIAMLLPMLTLSSAIGA